MDVTKSTSRTAAGLLAAAALAGVTHAQIFVRNSADVPDQTGSPNRYTENVDFGDVDNDGDFDAALAKGGDFGNLQDQLWINLGGAQNGALGRFRDLTASHFPAVARDGRDIEFVDFDNDADLDIYVSNTSTNSNQSNQWFVNEGGKQGGSIGFYADDTANRWVGLAAPGSSIASTLLIGDGFIDWSCDCDFGDLDNDGDMDLVHSTYGGNFNGQVPTRIFLNDGDGRFQEFNPSGFQLPGSIISPGDPGLWCEGVFQPSTPDTTGAECDIATSTLDIDVGDVDGDFDIDILHGDRNALPRFFYNRLEENGGTPADLAFRDVTDFAFTPGYSTGGGHYEQEMGDFDGDNDLDIYGLNWNAGGFNGLEDVTLENDDTGRFVNTTPLPNSGSDDNEGDFGDFDNDGDLDLLVANFSGDDRLYENVDGMGTLDFVPAATSGLSDHSIGGYTSLDADWADVDGDGDYDYFSAQDNTSPVVYWENQTQVPDTHAPRVAPVESLADADAGASGDPDRAVRTHVYDNAPYYTTWYNPTRVAVEVDGVEIAEFPARTSGGQVFRAEIPSNLVGDVTYRFESEDQYGNLGVSAPETYVASEGALTNEIVYGTPFVGTSGLEYEVHSRSILTAGKTWYAVVDTKGAPQFYLLVVSLGSTAPTANPVLGTINIDLSQIVVQVAGATDSAGFGVKAFPIDPTIGGAGTFSVFAQAYVAEPGFTSFSASRGIEVPFQ